LPGRSALWQGSLGLGGLPDSERELHRLTRDCNSASDRAKPTRGESMDRRRYRLMRAVPATALLLLLGGCVEEQIVTSARPYDIREESTAITNLAVISPDNLWVVTQPSFVDERNLVYSAKQWSDDHLPTTVSIWRSPSLGGAATKLVPGGADERLLFGRASSSSRNVYMSVACSLFSTAKSVGLQKVGTPAA